ncbi:autotransporter domain-containing protein [Martelella lutilitoris]|uniref:Autotransporter domain-containing protein n=1 Tax=Martelella lutilitoris TaxID=2583532 RepID=A0A7T7HNQ3_9HYPH|nr:autotransporter domain-containing protein [Martelella lutilitoris]QQM32413.1 autotransporter domain-containing protein [Martelella lutilitoris]
MRNVSLRLKAARSVFLSSSALFLLWGTPGVAADFLWTGAESTDWYTANNWLENGAATTNTPKAGDNVTIDTTTNAPVLPTDGGTEYINTIIIGRTATGQMTSNATINGENTRLGSLAGGNGTLTLGAGGAIQMDKSIIVGDFGTGRIGMTDGATGQTASIILGNSAGSSGTVTLSGSGTSLRTYGSGDNGLSVANSGTGTLTVSNGAYLESDQAIIGRHAGGEGSITLSGTGTEWNGYGATTIGSSGTGTVLVESGAHAISGSLTIGENASSLDNEATVTGSGSLWNVYNDISLGGNVNTGGTGGEGTLSVLNGATMTASNAYIGNVSGGEGTAYVDGAGSKLQLSASLRVGRNGDGRLAVSSGGSVSADFALVGANENSTGLLVITDAGSEMTLTNRMTVGATGEGLLDLENGGTLNSNGGIIGRDAGSVGVVGVLGGAAWNNTSTLDVGSEGTGLLDIFDGGTVTNGTARIGTNATGQGVVVVSGAGSSWAVDGGITVGVEGEGLLLVTDGGTVTSTASTLGSAADSIGIAMIDGAGSSWAIEGDLTVGEDGNGALVLSDEGTLSADNLVLAENSGSVGILVIGSIPDEDPAAPGALDVNELSFGDGQGYLIFNHTSSDYEFSSPISGTVDIEAYAGTTILTADNTNEGNTYIDTGAEIQVGNGGMTGTLQGNAAIETGGKLSFARSDDIEFAGLLRGTGTVSQKGPGTLRLTADNDQFAGTLEAESGTFLVDGSLRGTKADIKAGASFGGSGEIGSTTVRTGGTFLSGDEKGSITVNGDLDFEPDATYAAVIQTSQVPAKVTGTVAFDETELDVDFVDGGELKQQYTLLEAGEITGTYEAPLASLPSQFRGTISQDANRLNMSLAYVGGNFNFSALGRGVNDQLVKAFNDGVPLTGTLSAGMLQSGSAYEAAMTTLGGELGINATMTANLGMQDFLRRSSNPSRLFAGWRPIEEKDEDTLPSAGETSALAYWNLGTPSSRQPQWDWASAGRGATYGGAYGSSYGAPYAPYRSLTPANSIWLEYNGETASVDGDSGAGNSGADITGNIVEGGYLAQLDDTTAIGFVFGGGQTRYDQTEQNGSADSQSLHAAVTAAGQTAQGLYGLATVGLGVDSIDTERTVAFGTTSDRLRGSYSATTFGGRFEAGGRIVNGGMAFIPFAAASAVYTSAPSYQEEVAAGLGSSALAYSDSSLFRGTVEAGLGFDTAAGDYAQRFSFNSRVSYLYRYGGGGNANASFLALPGYGFSISSNAPTGSAVTANIGARIQLTPQADLSLGAYGEWGAEYSALIASAKLRYIW